MYAIRQTNFAYVNLARFTRFNQLNRRRDSVWYPNHFAKIVGRSNRHNAQWHSGHIGTGLDKSVHDFADGTVATSGHDGIVTGQRRVFGRCDAHAFPAGDGEIVGEVNGRQRRFHRPNLLLCSPTISIWIQDDFNFHIPRLSRMTSGLLLIMPSTPRRASRFASAGSFTIHTLTR